MTTAIIAPCDNAPTRLWLVAIFTAELLPFAVATVWLASLALHP